MGEPDTLAALPALAERYAAAVVTLTLDVGQAGSAAAWRDRALAAGAVRAHVVDAREELLRDYLLPALQAGAVSGAAAGTGGALLRVLLARKLLEVGAMEGAAFFAHGLPAGSDAAAHLEATIRRRQPDCLIVPAADLVSSREDQGVECSTFWRRVVVRASRREPALQGVPGVRPGLLTVLPPDRCPAAPAVLAVTFREGLPVALNGIEMSLVELVEAVDTIAGDHGVGRRVTTTEDGDGWRVEIVESPAGVVLSAAWQSLALAVSSPALWRIHRHLGRQYARLLLSGHWMTDAREALDVFAGAVRQRVSGTVSVRLRRGRCRVVGRDLAAPGRAGRDAATPSPSSVPGAALGADASLPH